MTYPHAGGPQFFADMTSIAIEKGWDFTYFNYWHRPVDSVVQTYDYKDWDPSYWNEILTSLQQGGASVCESNTNSNVLRILDAEQNAALYVQWLGAPSAVIHGTIYDLLGRMRLSFDYTNMGFTLNTSYLSQGAYFLVLSSGQERVSGHFSVTH